MGEEVSSASLCGGIPDRIDLRHGPDVVRNAALRIAAILEGAEPVVVDLSRYARSGHWIELSVESTGKPWAKGAEDDEPT